MSSLIHHADSFPKNVGQTLADMRISLGWSREEVAKTLGVSTFYILGIEKSRLDLLPSFDESILIYDEYARVLMLDKDMVSQKIHAWYDAIPVKSTRDTATDERVYVSRVKGRKRAAIKRAAKVTAKVSAAGAKTTLKLAQRSTDKLSGAVRDKETLRQRILVSRIKMADKAAIERRKKAVRTKNKLDTSLPKVHIKDKDSRVTAIAFSSLMMIGCLGLLGLTGADAEEKSLQVTEKRIDNTITEHDELPKVSQNEVAFNPAKERFMKALPTPNVVYMSGNFRDPQLTISPAPEIPDDLTVRKPKEEAIAEQKKAKERYAGVGGVEQPIFRPKPFVDDRTPAEIERDRRRLLEMQ